MVAYPFTQEEVFSALSLVLPEMQARQLSEATANHRTDSLGWMLPMETLVLLSLVSPDLQNKVEAFCRSYWPTLDGEEWSRTREEMRRAIAAGEVGPVEAE